jgi:hypothetical protein
MPQPDKGLWPHLPSAFGPERPHVNKVDKVNVGAAMWPSLGPQSKPAPNRYSDSTTLAARADADPLLEYGLALMGLIRKR